jgi:hypothetical protein
MIRAFAAVLEDENSLVRRAALDLLVTSLRMDSLAVKDARAEDRTILMRAACSVVLRRDLALNRRLYTWLLGPEESPEHQSLYFRNNALDLLKSALEVCTKLYDVPRTCNPRYKRKKCSTPPLSTLGLAPSRSLFRCSINGKLVVH